MGIILKFILKNIKEKKLRTFLVVVSIMASTALFFAANGIANVFTDSAVNISKDIFGSAEIMITASDKSPSPYFLTNKVQPYSNRLDYIVGTVGTGGTYKHTKDDVVQVSLIGFNYDDLDAMNPIQFDSNLTMKPFTGNKIIISKKTADNYNLKLGSRLKLNIKDNNENFTIVGIAKLEGLFKVERGSIAGIIPVETAAGIEKQKGKVSTIYLKSKKSADVDGLIKDLSTTYKNYSVTKTIDMKQITDSTSTISNAFMAMLVIVLTMSMFIIYTVFKVIIVERLPVIGTFRSIGATRSTTNFVLIGESIIYGLIGGITGDIVGIGIVNLAGFGLTMVSGGVEMTINYTFSMLASSLVFAIVISFISAIIPIIRASRLSVKDVVLNTVDTVEKTKLWKLILGIFLVILALLIPNIVPKKLALILDIICMVFGTVALIILVPYITKISALALEKILGLIFKNEGILATKNIRSNRNIINNISLLAIGISALFMLNVVSYSFAQELIKAYQISSADIYVGSKGGELNKDVLAKIKNADGVYKTYASYDASSVGVIGTSTKIGDVMGYNIDGFHDFMNIDYNQDKKSVLKDFSEGRNIILNESVRKSLDINVGDIITLKTMIGNENYKVTGSFNSLMNNGSMGVIPEKYLKQDFKVSKFSSIFVLTSKDPNTVSAKLNSLFKGKQLNIMTWKQMEDQNAQTVNVMLSIIKIFPIVAMCIGAFGVLNNFIISFIERKRYLAIYASVGMSKSQTIKMLFLEATAVGLIGAISGILGGLISTYIIPCIFKAINFPMEMHYQSQLFITCIILGIAITVVSSIGPAIKSSKLNIIEAIKFE